MANHKVTVIKEIVDVEAQTQDLPLRFQYTLEDVIKEKLRAEGALATGCGEHTHKVTGKA